jgi:hypothetical protein
MSNIQKLWIAILFSAAAIFVGISFFVRPHPRGMGDHFSSAAGIIFISLGLSYFIFSFLNYIKGKY